MPTDDHLTGMQVLITARSALAEQAAEAARACAASARIGKRVCELGSGGWGVLCDCAQTVLRTSRACAGAVLRVGHAAMKTPSEVMMACDGLRACEGH